MGAATDDARQTTRRLGEQRDERLGVVQRYAEGPLARRLHCRGQTPRVEPAQHGKRSLVYFVDFPQGPSVVLRAVPRLAEAWTLAHNLQVLGAKGLRVPKLLAASFCPLGRLRWGFWPVVEERIQGKHLDDLGRPEAAVRAAAGTLAEFHNVERSRWGRPVLPRWGSYRRHLLDRMEQRAYHFDAVLATPRADPLMVWCRQHAAESPLDPPFALTHNRIYTPNFVVTPDHRAYAVDLVECRFASFGIDLTWALKRLCADEPRATAWFLDAYFAQRPTACREAYERSRDFFEVDYHLARASIYARRYPRRLHVPHAKREKLNALRRHATRLRELTHIEFTVKTL
ncbi:hypothetical protein HQ576_05390 [bacterium]|nr:hypothetical protein [bacterium]